MSTLVPFIGSFIPSFLLFLFIDTKISFVDKINYILIHKYNRKEKYLPLFYFFIEILIIILVSIIFSLFSNDHNIWIKIIMGITIGFFMTFICKLNSKSPQN